MLSPIPKWLGSEAASEPLVQKLFFHAAEENYTLPPPLYLPLHSFEAKFSLP